MFRKKTANVPNVSDYIVMQMRKANREKGYSIVVSIVVVIRRKKLREDSSNSLAINFLTVYQVFEV